ncbi:MAG: hypothetical protein V3T31_02920 [candidate division Zixibacteria bacterium]
MRIFDPDNNETLSGIHIYMTTPEIAELYGHLGAMLNDTRARRATVADPSFDHNLTIFAYNEHEQSRLDERQKRIVRYDQ